MECFKSFIPDIFKKLTKEEKMDAITNLSNNICKELNLENIKLYFNGHGTNENLISGKFIYNPTCIYINDFFIDEEKAKQCFSDKINLDLFLPYYLLHTVSHECYHYYQSCLVNKLINNELTNEKDKDLAYLCFISLYSDIFAKFCTEKNILPPTKLTKEDLYNYSPCEIGANVFGKKMVSLLAKKDICTYNYNYFCVLSNILDNTRYCNDVDNEIAIKVIKNNLETTISFLNYKNENSGLQKKYLDIDENDLKESINRTLTNMSVSTNKNKGISKLLDKINKK